MFDKRYSAAKTDSECHGYVECDQETTNPTGDG